MISPAPGPAAPPLFGSPGPVPIGPAAPAPGPAQAPQDIGIPGPYRPPAQPQQEQQPQDGAQGNGAGPPGEPVVSAADRKAAKLQANKAKNESLKKDLEREDELPDFTPMAWGEAAVPRVFKGMKCATRALAACYINERFELLRKRKHKYVPSVA